MGGILQIMLANAIALVCLAIVGVACAWSLARLMDWSNHRRRHRPEMLWMSNIRQEPLPASIYYGARWLGICVLVGWLFSRVV